MAEDVKRLAPTPTTLRELYLRSGNICALPDCHTLLIDKDGVFCGEVCHIAAAEKGGPRFDKTMTNEDRRSFDNLLLLCPVCHTKIDKNPGAYTTDMLKNIKQEHELKSGNFLEKIKASIPDLQDLIQETECTKCVTFANELKFSFTSDEEYFGVAKSLNSLLNKLKLLPPETRELLSIMVRHSYKDPRGALVINIFELSKFIERKDDFIYKHIELISKAGITSEPYDGGIYDNTPHISLAEDETGWNYWEDIVKYCKLKSILLDTIIFDLNFAVFD